MRRQRDESRCQQPFCAPTSRTFFWGVVIWGLFCQAQNWNVRWFGDSSYPSWWGRCEVAIYLENHKDKMFCPYGFWHFFCPVRFFQIRPCPAANPLLTSVVFLKSWICRTGSDSMSVSSRETSLHCCQVKPVKNPLSMFFKLKSVTPCAIWTYHSNPQKVSKRFNSITSKSRGFYHFSLGVL